MAHRQQSLMAISERIGTPRFRFYLQNASAGLLQLFYAPDGWKDAKFELKRHPIYRGLFRSISFNQLTFRKDARDFIQTCYEGQGVNAVVTFIVQRLDDATQVYTSYFTGKLDLSTYKIDETGVTCQIVDTQLAEKVKNRENIKVNIRQRTSIEGFEIPAFSNEDPAITFPEYSIDAHATWGHRANMDTVLLNHYVPLWLGLGVDFTEAQSQNADTPISDGNAMFENSLADRSVQLSGHISGVCYLDAMQPHVTFMIRLYVAGVAVATIGTVSGNNVNNLAFDFDFDESFSFLTGQDFWLQGTLDRAGTTIYDNDISVIMSENLETVVSTACIAYPYYEAFLRVLQIIADQASPFYSTEFGRTDSEVTTYASDGRLGHIAKGLFIRDAIGFNDSMAISFSDLFKSLSGLFSIGMGIEQIGGVDKVVIEDLQYFYSSTVVADLSGRIREAAIEKEVLPEMHFNLIKSGYNSFEYLEVGGLSEFNTKTEFSTVIASIDNSLDIISRYRADTQGIILLRKNNRAEEDIKGDEDIFLIDSIRQTLPFTGFKARTGEGFTLVTGGADADNSYNLDYTPVRNLLRHGAEIRAGLEKNLGTYLRWQSSDKNTSLQTQLTTESTPIAENADILVNDLTEPFFLPEKYFVKCEMRYSDLSAILANPKGLIKLSATKYGWVTSLIIGNKENLAEITLLRANLNVITPV